MDGAADEIAKIEHELAMLRERYTIFHAVPNGFAAP